MPEGPTLLREFLARHSISLREAGAQLGFSHITIRSWLLRRAKPRESVRSAIERWTAGAVPADAWLTRKDLLALRRLAAIGRCPQIDAAA